MAELNKGEKLIVTTTIFGTVKFNIFSRNKKLMKFLPTLSLNLSDDSQIRHDMRSYTSWKQKNNIARIMTLSRKAIKEICLSHLLIVFMIYQYVSFLF